VKTHYDVVLSSLELAQKNAKNWGSFGKYSVNGSKVALEFKHTDKHTMINFDGYEYKKFKSEISGAEVIAYHPEKREVWNVPYYQELVPSLEVTAPKEGYFIQPPEAALVIPVLDVHGIKHTKWTKKFPEEVEVYRATKKEFSKDSFEGHQILKVNGAWKTEKVQFLPGTIFVPIGQKAPKLILQILEPEGQDSLLSWGFFNRYFEQKEYMENYVAHQVGEEMLKDMKTREEFEKMLEKTEFRKSPEARYEFFYKKHSSWDQRLDRYPVYKL
jgi:hypothetical protein